PHLEGDVTPARRVEGRDGQAGAVRAAVLQGPHDPDPPRDDRRPRREFRRLHEVDRLDRLVRRHDVPGERDRAPEHEAVHREDAVRRGRHGRAHYTSSRAAASSSDTSSPAKTATTPLSRAAPRVGRPSPPRPLSEGYKTVRRTRIPPATTSSARAEAATRPAVPGVRYVPRPGGIGATVRPA